MHRFAIMLNVFTLPDVAEQAVGCPLERIGDTRAQMAERLPHLFCARH